MHKFRRAVDDQAWCRASQYLYVQVQHAILRHVDRPWILAVLISKDGDAIGEKHLSWKLLSA